MDVSGDQQGLDEAIKQSGVRALLLVFWAPWHVRSRDLLDEAGRLAQEHADELCLRSVNVDLDVASAMRFGMRSVPLLILFREGREVARTAGPTGCERLSPWLWRQGIALAAMPAGFALPRQIGLAGAFHGDSALRERLHRHLHELASQGRILRRRFPFWCEGRGTISAALSCSTRPDIVETQTGLPFSFACALEFLGLEWTPALVDWLFAELPVGMDVSQIALRLVQSHMADPEVDWREIIADPRLDALRQQWLRLTDRQLCGLPVAGTEWDALLLELGLLRSQGRNPERSVQDAVIDLLGTLSPPPAHDNDLWVSAISLHGIYLLHVAVEHDQGWTHEDFAFEGRRGQWFLEREQREPGGRFTPERLEIFRQEWMQLHGDEQKRYDAMLEEAGAHFPLMSNRLRQRLVALLREQKIAACA